uniref:Uncharacterized protein n=1 Tax=Arundo donax TaxID=35708 RepID=A0A0A9AZQ1_ARUDO
MSSVQWPGFMTWSYTMERNL